jgi:DNA modification methylase
MTTRMKTHVHDVVNTIISGNSLDVLKTFPDDCIDMVMTSPPYWAQRFYFSENELGQEITFKEYICNLVNIFDEVKRVLKPAGCAFINIADTFYGGNKGNGGMSPEKSKKQLTNKGSYTGISGKRFKNKELPDKCMCLISDRFAIEMVDRGWILRNKIIWHKNNPMPSSVVDRFTLCHEDVFFFTKNKKYYFEQQLEPFVTEPNAKELDRESKQKYAQFFERKDHSGSVGYGLCGRNKRTVWSISNEPLTVDHYASFPSELCDTPIRAGCPQFICSQCGKPRLKYFKREGKTSTVLMKEANIDRDKFHSGQGRKPEENIRAPKEAFERPIVDLGYREQCKCGAKFVPGIVLDPFMGSGTVAIQAKRLGRQYIGIEINPKYIEIANKRIEEEVGLLF